MEASPAPFQSKNGEEKSVAPSLAAAFAVQGATLIESVPVAFDGIRQEKFAGFSAGTIRALENLAESSAKYISSPIITDSFSDHEERRAWRTTMRNEHGDEAHKLLESNRLRLNAMSSLLFRASTLKGALEKETDSLYLPALKAEVLGIIGAFGQSPQMFNQEYGAMDSEQKLAVAQDLSKRLQAFLFIVTV